MREYLALLPLSQIKSDTIIDLPINPKKKIYVFQTSTNILHTAGPYHLDYDIIGCVKKPMIPKEKKHSLKK
jgi:hypothetical protein